jgi:hypothetical protein
LGAIPGRKATGTGLAFTSIWFCASLEPQEGKKRKENSFQVDGEHVAPGGITGIES